MTSNTELFYQRLEEEKTKAMQEAAFSAAKQSVLTAMYFEEEIAGWMESQSRTHLERLLRQDNATWYVGPGKPNINIATHIIEYLEFLDLCEKEKQAQEDQRKANPIWGSFG